MTRQQKQDRQYSHLANNTTKYQLELLADPSSDSQTYQNALKVLGRQLAQSIVEKLGSVEPRDITLAVTAEDADYLARGFIEKYEQKLGKKVFLACFWNDHRIEDKSKKSIAPVVNEYLQPGFESNHTLVVIKSIISGSCVVRSNILSLYQRMSPDNIFIAAPVMHIDAESKLSADFPVEFLSKFSFTWFAKDSLKEGDGTVLPGVGGQVYERLGLHGKPHETHLMPNEVRTRIIAS
ncbi:hypothetical protein [Salinivibrio kushneri]|uniref:hypothetical protein n=1 Tax=Salinivibrio kushneri TaxID=1908198 RepID=UPI000984D7D9|nr:hypothetical protein [Salinivibrio kushneri]OOE58782.1 hypothetical protein BZG18_14365 [Salinivibrio kushneri]